jgi:hypothetical protein
MVSDRGDRCEFNFIYGRRLFFEVFPFPVCKAEFIGNWLENSEAHRTVRAASFFRILTFLTIFCVRAPL